MATKAGAAAAVTLVAVALQSVQAVAERPRERPLVSIASSVRSSIHPLPGHVSKSVGTWTVPVRFPAGAEQGGEGWYGMRVRCRLNVVPGPHPRLIYITGSTAGQPSVSIRVKVPSARSTAPVRWDAYGWIDGNERHASRATEIVVEARNFLQYKGVRAGRTTASVKVEQYGGGTSNDLEVLPGTALLAGLASPARLAMKVRSAEQSTSGDRPSVPVDVWNAGGMTERDVVIATASDPDGPAVPMKTMRIGDLRGGEHRRVMVPLPSSTHGGRQRVRLVARGATASAARTIGVIAPPVSGWMPAPLRALLAILVALLPAAVFLLGVRVHRRRQLRASWHVAVR